MKRLADVLTAVRILLALGIIGAGLFQGADGVPTAIVLLLAAWTTDFLDGPLARRSRCTRHTWIGDHDLCADIAVGVAVAVYLGLARFVSVVLTSVYLVAWAVALFLHGSVPKPFGALFQGPIYLCFVYVSIKQVPDLGWWLIGWALLTNALTYKRLFGKSLPEFFRGLRVNWYLRPSDEACTTTERAEG